MSKDNKNHNNNNKDDRLTTLPSAVASNDTKIFENESVANLIPKNKNVFTTAAVTKPGEMKGAAAAATTTKPGVQQFDSSIDPRISAKIRRDAPSTRSRVTMFDPLVSDNNASTAAAAATTKLGAVISNQLDSLEARIRAKNNQGGFVTRRSSGQQDDLDARIANKQRRGSNEQQLDDLEARIANKQRRNSNQQQLNDLEARTSAKQRRSSKEQQLNDLEARISAKQKRNSTETNKKSLTSNNNDDPAIIKVYNMNTTNRNTNRAEQEDRKYLEALYDAKHDNIGNNRTKMEDAKHDNFGNNRTKIDDAPPPTKTYDTPHGGIIDQFNEDGFMPETDMGPLAVAVAISPDEERLFIPFAIEYDPDSKPPIYKNRRFRFYLLAGGILLFAITVSAVLAVITRSDSFAPTETAAPTSLRESFMTSSREEKIWKVILKEIGETSFLGDTDSATARALKWIMYEDQLNLTEGSENLVQRFICVLFYLSTSNWLTCNRPLPGESSNCTGKKLISIEPDLLYEDKPGSLRWLSHTHECYWNGIECDALWRIRAFEIRGQNISGTLPTEIAKMPYIQSLSMMWNKMYGTLPPEIASMKYLLNIELHFNMFTGTIPLSWYEARALQRINTASNFLSGSVPIEIGLLRTLKGYFNFDNAITGTIPTEIGQMKFLAYTRWYRNVMTGTLPTEIGNLKKLQEIWMHRNLLEGQLPSELGMLKDIADVRLHFNRFSGTIPNEIYNMTQLRRLDLYDCNFTSTISTYIGQLRALKTYRIRRNNFYGTIPSILGQLPLEWVWLHQNKLSGSVPMEICARRSAIKNVGLYILTADCTAPVGDDDPIIDCLAGCCTACCDPSIGLCYKEDP